jgi:hypothetical protein
LEPLPARNFKGFEKVQFEVPLSLWRLLSEVCRTASLSRHFVDLKCLELLAVFFQCLWRLRTRLGKTRQEHIERSVLESYLSEVGSSSLRQVDAEHVLRDPPLVMDMALLPFSCLRLRHAKYNVVLREAELWSVQAYHTILSRRLVFHCKVCNEIFPVCHPAYEAPDHIEMELLRGSKDDMGRAEVSVAEWDDLPDFEVGAVIADLHVGTCLRCGKDMKQQLRACEVSGGEIVPKFSHIHNMDPCWKFPMEELGDSFKSCSIVEACLVALEHMEVSYVTIYKSRLHKFRKNVISFPQCIGPFFGSHGALCQFRVDERVNSNRGPGADARGVDA